MRLGINIDHIATLRQARKENFPDPVLAAKEALLAGADGIVCHLREDRRHIQDKDVWALKEISPRLDFEMAATDEMVNFALKLKPYMVTLVPEKRQEITTEGGLDIKSEIKKQKSEIKSKIKKLQDKGILVSLFIDPEKGQIEAAQESGAHFIEIHTGSYALSPKKEISKIREVCAYAKKIGLRVNAGHGLDYANVAEIVKIKEIEELNIGFSIIARSVFVGMQQAVAEMLKSMGEKR